MTPATLRKWRQRAKEAPEPSVSLPGESTAEGEQSGTPAERLRAAAEKARQASSRALDQADSLLARGLASEARNASVVSSVHAERAQELESSARGQEEHEVALSEAQGRLVLDLVGTVFDDVALPRPDGLLRARLEEWPRDPDPEIVEQARREVRRSIAGEVRAEILAELEAERRALPAGETEGDDVALGEEVIDAEVVEEVEREAEPDGEPGWNDLPEPWKAKYLTQPRLGIYEYARACKAEEIARRLPRAPVRARPDFTHPGLRGLGGP